MFLDARKGVILAEKDEREAFVVAKKNVVRRPEALDQLRFQKQRLRLGPGRDDSHGSRLRNHPLQPFRQLRHLRVVGDPVPQCPRLAHVEDVAARVVHPIDARVPGQRPQHLADCRHALFEVGLLGATHGIGRLLFVEAVRSIGLVGTVGRGHATDLGTL